MLEPLKILIVDDSITYRSILFNILSAVPGVSVVSTASNGKSALIKFSQHEIDIVLLDIEMPEMDGLETLRAISERYPGTGVVMVSGMNRHSADITIQALESGALDFIPKPDHDDVEKNIEALRQRLLPIFKTFGDKHSLKGVNTAPVIERKANANASEIAPKSIRTPRKAPNIDIIVIGVSTGGPNALNELIPRLPGNLGVPILLVQHMPPIFTASLAGSLDKKSALQVKEAEEGEAIRPNTVYIAPGGRHMVVNARKIHLTDDPPENSCRPSVDVLFRSVAKTYGSHVLAVIMTGMGIDGAQGVRMLKAGPDNYCLTQNEESCVIYGMPRAVDESGLSDESLPLGELADRIVSLVKSRIAI